MSAKYTRFLLSSALGYDHTNLGDLEHSLSEQEVYPLTEDMRPTVSAFIHLRWGSEAVIAHGVRYLPAELEGFACGPRDALSGLVTYQIQGSRCEIVTIDSLIEGQGNGKRLIQAVRNAAVRSGCRELWLVTTNDNLNALRFYQRIGFRIASVAVGAVDTARLMKPEIPLIGLFGIPIHDEIEMVLPLTEDTAP